LLALEYFEASEIQTVAHTIAFVGRSMQAIAAKPKARCMRGALCWAAKLGALLAPDLWAFD